MAEAIRHATHQEFCMGNIGIVELVFCVFSIPLYLVILKNWKFLI